MKKNMLLIYIVMTLVGIVGLYLILGNEQPQVVTPPTAMTPVSAQPAQESITVAMATRDVPANALLTADDFRLQTLKINQGGSEKQQFSTEGKSLTGYLVDMPIAEGALIPAAALVEPGSERYLSLRLQPGHVLYSFYLSQTDNYLLDNIKPGQGIDIYLVYGKNVSSEGHAAIVSPASSIENTRLKALMKDRKVLALRMATVGEQNGVAMAENGSQLIVELKDRDVKVLKGLEGKAKIILFPASADQQDAGRHSDLPGMEAMWPVSDEVIFDATEPFAAINELRG